MSSDVFDKFIQANEIVNGRAISFVSETGTVYNKDRPTNFNVPTSGLEVKLSTRFDDPTYYTA